MAKTDERLESILGGKYRIVRFLAEGGMGAVYEAVHVVVRRRFAIKFLHPELTRRRDALTRFRQEATAAGALESEHIAAVVDFGVNSDGAPYLVLEYLDGVDLRRLLAALGPLPVERATDLVLQACHGMQEAHARGIVHRDLKPSNLFVCRLPDGADRLKIMDFGVAKLLESESSSAVTRTGSMVGTPAYMSPEQARGEPSIDHLSDVHALGVILYELLSGLTPHPGDSSNAIIHHLATQPALPLSGQGRELPSGLVEVVHRALSSDPVERQSSVEQLAQDLAPFAARRSWPSLSAPFSSRRPAAIASNEEERQARRALGESPSNYGVSQAGTPNVAERRSTGRRALGVLAFTIAGGAAALWSWSHSAEPLVSAPAPTPTTSVENPPRKPPDPARVIPNDQAATALTAAKQRTPESGSMMRQPVVPTATTQPRTRPPLEPGHPPGRPPRAPPAPPNAKSPVSQAAFDPTNPFD